MYDNTPLITWSPVTENSSPVLYNVLVDNVGATFGALADNSGWISGTTYPIGNELRDNGFYYLGVQAKDNAGNFGTRTVQTFRVDRTNPAAPTITYPTSEGAGVSDNTPAIAWTPVTDNGTNSYRVVIDNDSNFSSPENDSGWIYTPTYTSGYLADKMYFLRVAAKDGAGNYGDNRQMTFWIDTVAPTFSDNGLPIIARYRDNENRATYRETNISYYFENDNIWILVKMKENNLTVQGNFTNLNGGTENAVHIPENENRYLLRYKLTTFTDATGKTVSISAFDNANNTVASDGVSGRPEPFVVITNINPKENAATGLNSDNTTNWRSIQDFTRVDNLSFERMVNNMPVGKLRFLENLDLADQTTATALQNLGANLEVALGTMSLNSAASALAAMNKQTELTMFNLVTFNSSPGLLKNGVPVLQIGGTTSENVDNLAWDNTNKKLIFTARSWSKYDADGIAPDAPQSLAASPSSWTTTNSFTVSWTNPNGNSEISGAYYKVDNVPTTDNDGTLVDENFLTSISGITVSGENTHTIYVWLRDNVGNKNRDNRSSVTVYLDNSVPALPNITSSSVSENGSTTSTSISFGWAKVSGPSPVTYYYKLEGSESSYSENTDNTKSYSGLAVGSYTFRLYAKDNGGTSATDNYAFTITSTASTSITPPSPPSGSVVQTSTVSLGTVTAASETKVTVQNVPITELQIAVKTTLQNVSVTVQQSSSRPAEIAIGAPGVNYGYLYISTQNITAADIDHVLITFKVEKSWIRASGIDERTVMLSRYSSGAWTNLPTEKVTEDQSYVYYRSTSPGLSVFSISGYAATTTTTTTTPIGSAPTTTSGPSAGPLTIDPNLIYVGLAVAVAIAVIGLLLPKKSKAHKKA